MSQKYTIQSVHYSFYNKYLSDIIRQKMRYTFKQFKAEYPDDDACLEAVFQQRFGDLEVCPGCSAETTFYRVKKRQCYSCKWCGHQLFPLADTIFRKTTTSLWNWFYAIYLFGTSKNGVSAKELERHLGVSYKCAWRMAKQIRLLMTQEGLVLGDNDTPVEADETYAPSRKHPMKYGRSKKQSIFGMVERDGLVKARHVRSTGARVLLPEIQRSIAPGTHIHTDEWGAYRKLPQLGYSHTTVNHSELEYVRGTAHTNTIEGFWSQLKRSIDGTYHAVSPKYLQLYVDEFAFRYNHRNGAVGRTLLGMAGKRV